MSALAEKSVVHVSAWAEALWHFRMPLLRMLNESCRRMVIYCPEWEYSPSQEGHVQRLVSEGFEVKTAPVSGRPGLSLIPQAFALYRFLARERFDLLMAHQPMGALVGIPAAWMAGVPLKIYSTGGLRYVPGGRGLHNLAMKYGEAAVMRMSDAVFVVNRVDEEYLSTLDFARDKACYVGPRGGCGVDVSTYNPVARKARREAVRRELGIPHDTMVMGYTGRCVWEKGFREVVDAAALLRETLRDTGFLFLVVGDGTDLPGIKEYAAGKGVERHFKFIGYKYEVDYFMSAFDVFLLPSYREGLPVALLEAMAMGLPSIVTDIRGCSELITDGETGLLVPLGSHKRLAEAVMFMNANPEAAGAMGDAASRYILENFGEETMVERTKGIIEGLLSSGKGC